MLYLRNSIFPRQPGAQSTWGEPDNTLAVSFLKHRYFCPTIANGLFDPEVTVRHILYLDRGFAVVTDAHCAELIEVRLSKILVRKKLVNLPVTVFGCCE